MEDTDKEICSKSENGTLVFGIFMLSRGIYNLKKAALNDLSKFAIEVTDSESLPEWMECDKLYMFRADDLKKEAKAPMYPFSFLFPLIRVSKMLLVDGNKFALKFQLPDRYIVLSFGNIIECWKFYNYGRILYHNSKEFYKSFSFDIDVNMRILFDDQKIDNISTVVSTMINDNNAKENAIITEKTKKAIDDDFINFPALTNLFQKMLISLYSMENPEENFPKMKIITEEFHKYYFQFIQELFKNPYTDVL